MKITEFLERYKGCFPVGDGWKPIIIKLINDIIDIDKDVNITTIKEKFGGLRFYISGGSDEIFDLIDKAEEESFKVCEECGTRENVETKGSWLKTLCKKCRKNA